MWGLIASLLGIALLGGCAPRVPAGPAPVPGQRVTLELMGTTDIHGWLLPHDYYTGEATRNGLLLLKPMIDSVRVAHPGRTVLVDSGDILQGNPLNFVFRDLGEGEAHPVIAAMNEMAYDAAAIGNHEYNYGIPHLEQAVRQADFPLLSVNTFVAGTDRHAFRPYTIVDRPVDGGTVRVGIAGITPPGVLLWDQQNVAGRLDFRDVVESMKPVVAEMKAEGADLVVVASHGGLEGSSYDPVLTGVPVENMGVELARQIPDIDVIFLGHTHRELADTTINQTLLLQAKNWGESLAVATVDLVADGSRHWQVADKSGRILRPAEGARSAPPSKVVGDAHERTVAYVGREVGESRAELTSRRSRVEDTPILDFINEVQRRAAGADLASSAAFSIASRIPRGPFTVADVAGLYIYDNTLKAIRISGQQLREYIEKSAEYYLPCPDADCDRIVNPDIPGYNFDALSGVDYVIDLSRPVGARVTELSRNGVPVVPSDSFTLALNNYRASGAGGFNMLAGAPVVYDQGEEIRQLLIDEVERQGGLDPAAYFRRNWRMVPESLVEKAAAEQSGPSTSSSGSTKRLRVLGTNDFHGTLRSTRPSFADGATVGGADILATYFREAQAEVDYPTILLDGGDVMQGTPLSNLTGGRSTVDYYNTVGYTAAALGNHEFDWGVETLKARVEQAEFAWLASNVFVAGTDTLPSWLEPTHMVRLPGCASGCDSVTVGIIGIATMETPQAAMPSYVAPFDFRSESDAINHWVPILRQRGADFVIVVSHEGAYCPAPDARAEECEGPMLGIASRLTDPPDLIVSGHTHTVLNIRPSGIPVVQAGSYGTTFSVVDLERVSADSVAVRVIRQPVTYADSVAADSQISALLASYEGEVGERLRDVVTRLDRPLLRGEPEFSLGNLIADAQRAATGTQVAIMNNGGIRIDLPAGPVNYEDLFRLQPFANTLVTVELSGAELLEALEQTLARGYPHAHVSGVTVHYDPEAPEGERVVGATLDGGERVIGDGRYTVTANNFMFDGGDGFEVLNRAADKNFTGIVDLDALIEYIQSLPTPLPVPPVERYIRTER